MNGPMLEELLLGISSNQIRNHSSSTSIDTKSAVNKHFGSFALGGGDGSGRGGYRG